MDTPIITHSFDRTLERYAIDDPAVKALLLENLPYLDKEEAAFALYCAVTGMEKELLELVQYRAEKCEPGQ